MNRSSPGRQEKERNGRVKTPEHKVSRVPGSLTLLEHKIYFG